GLATTPRPAIRTRRAGGEAARERTVHQILHIGSDPTILFMAALQSQLQVVATQGLGEICSFSAAFPGRSPRLGYFFFLPAESDSFDSLTDKAPHEGMLFFAGEIAEDAIALAGDVDRNLSRH